MERESEHQHGINKKKNRNSKNVKTRHRFSHS